MEEPPPLYVVFHAHHLLGSARLLLRK